VDYTSSAGEERVFHDVLPLLNTIETDLGVHVDEIVFLMLSRRLASRGYKLRELVRAVRENFTHQLEYERGTSFEKH